MLSDVVLAATAHYGQGKVVGIGDSSLLQDVLYARSGRFVRHLLAWLQGGRTRTLPGQHAEFLAILLLVAALVPLVGPAPGFVTAGCITLSTIGLIASERHATVTEPDIDGPRCILLDLPTSLVNRDSFVDDAYLSLPLNLTRHGYCVEWQANVAKALSARPDVVFLLAPTQRFSSGDTQRLQKVSRQRRTARDRLWLSLSQGCVRDPDIDGPGHRR